MLLVVSAWLALTVAPTSAQPADPAAPPSTPAPQPAAAEQQWFHPFAVFNINANFNSAGLLPGSFGLFALPDVDVARREQFNISAANTLLGAVFVFPKVNETQITAKIDANLRGNTPTDPQNLLEFLFLDAYLQLKTGNTTLLAGLAPDVVSPLVPTTLNEFPASYVPGSLGYVRPQVRVEQAFAAGADGAVTLQGALTQAVQTFKISGEADATQSGWPDVQLRGAFGHGAPSAEGKRPIEVGVWGHFGERRLQEGTDSIFRNSYSFGFDGRAQFTPKTKVQGEYFTGQVLADYLGGILQSFDPVTSTPVDAQGFWLEVEQALNATNLVHAGYGVDNVEEEKLGLVLPRIQNEMFYANLMHGFSKELSVAGEFAWWRTKYRGLPDANPLRIEFAIIYKFAK